MGISTLKEYLSIDETLNYLNNVHNEEFPLNHENLIDLVLQRKIKPLFRLNHVAVYRADKDGYFKKFLFTGYCYISVTDYADFSYSEKILPMVVYLYDIQNALDIEKHASSTVNKLAIKQGKEPPIKLKQSLPLQKGDMVTFSDDIKLSDSNNLKDIQRYCLLKKNIRFHIDELKKLIGMIEESNNPQAEIQQLKAELAQVKEQLAKQSTNKQGLPATSNNSYDWQSMNEYQYPPELHLAIMIWKKIYIDREIQNNHIDNHSDRFNAICKKIGVNKDNVSKAMIERLQTITTPQTNKTKKDIAKLKTIKALYLK